MREYKIKSPSGKVLAILADTFYYAIQLAIMQDGYTYPAINYFSLNRR